MNEKQIQLQPKNSLKACKKNVLNDDNEKNGLFSGECSIGKQQTLKSFNTIKVLPALKEFRSIKAKRQEFGALKEYIEQNNITAPLVAKYTHSRLKHFEWREMDLGWLVEHLLSPNPKIRGGHIKIPDTVFLKDGKFKLRIKTDKNGFLFCYRSQKRLEHTEIRSQFPTIVRERRKKKATSDALEMMIEADSDVEISLKKAISNTSDHESMISFKKSEAYKNFSQPINKSLIADYYHDMAIVQYNSNPGQPDITIENEDSIYDRK